MKKMRMESVDMTSQNIEKIGALFPNCITESVDENGKLRKAINFDLLRQMLSGDVVEGDEAYEFTWVGKKAAIVEANKPIRKTLRPCPEESKDWDTTENLYIEGDNLEVLKLLQESYLSKVKIIYIDPPYNTGSDNFIYPDNFEMDTEEYETEMGMYDENGLMLFRENNVTHPRFHSRWCSMLYQRLILARNLLTDDGLIFISIDDNEQRNAAKICDEVFGSSNFVGCIARVAKTTSFKGNFFAPSKDYVLVYAKQITNLEHFSDDVEDSQFKKIEVDGPRKGEHYRDDIAFYLSTLDITRGSYAQRYWIECPDGSKVIPPGKTFPPQKGEAGDGVWRWGPETYAVKKDLIVFKQTTRSPLLDEHGNRAKWNLYTKSYLNDRDGGNVPRDYWDSFLNRNGSEMLKKLNIPFDYAKPVQLIEYILKITHSNDDSIILDFFSGSATTAHAVMNTNSQDSNKRKFIMVQYPEACPEGTKAYKQGFSNICEIGKERIRRAGDKLKEESPLTTADLDIGFRVFKLDDTNMTDVYYSADEYSQDMLTMLESNIKPDRTDLDLLFGCLLEWGLPLSMPYHSENLEGCKVHTYNDGDLIACFDENVPDSVIKEIAKRKPLRAVFRDSSFASSPAKINVGEVFKMLAPDTRVKVI